jgi:hypothetical protein
MPPEPIAGASAAEQPILWLGMSGFAPQQRSQLEASLGRPSGSPRWRICDFGDADAWWVSGAKVHPMPDGNLKVAAGLPTEHALKLNLSEVDRPVAFAAPPASSEFAPALTFDPASQSSIHAVLLQFENSLRLVRAQFVLGAQIIQRSAELRHGIYHISHRGALLAVLDFREGKAGLSAQLHPVGLHDAQWDKRPIGARDMPESFVRTSLAQLTWAYVRRTDRNLLEARYRAEMIYYRHAPRVPLRWLRDSQLMLLRELSAEPGTLEALRQRTGFAVRHMEHDLSCLYYAGAITTTRAKAATPMATHYESHPPSLGPGMDSLLSGEAHSDYKRDLTVPASLEHKPVPERADYSQGQQASRRRGLM